MVGTHTSDGSSVSEDTECLTALGSIKQLIEPFDKLGEIYFLEHRIAHTKVIIHENGLWLESSGL